MNKLELKGTWNEAKGKLKQKYANLTMTTLRSGKARKTKCSDGCSRRPVARRKSCARRFHGIELAQERRRGLPMRINLAARGEGTWPVLSW